MTAPALIRRATPADARAIGALKVRAWRAAYASFLPAGYLADLDPAAEAAGWKRYLADRPATHRLWVARTAAGRPLAGYCRTGPAEGDDLADLGAAAGEVYGLYLDPDLVGTGLGRELFGHAVDDLRSRAYRPVCVYAYTPNVRAIRFYRKAGFEPDGVTRLDPDDPIGVPEIRLVSAG